MRDVNALHPELGTMVEAWGYDVIIWRITAESDNELDSASSPITQEMQNPNYGEIPTARGDFHSKCNTHTLFEGRNERKEE